ncbi:MAG TPA: hypothetical protein VF220_10420 [Nitrososphaeraceae archaeon]
MNNKQALNSAGASKNYSEIQKEGRTIPLSDILSRGRIMVLVSMGQKRIFNEDSKKNLMFSLPLLLIFASIIISSQLIYSIPVVNAANQKDRY